MNRKLYEAVPLKEWEEKNPGQDFNLFPYDIVDTSGIHVLVAVEEVDKWISPEKMFEFMDWLIDNGWKLVYSETLRKRAYVDSSKNDILINGSAWHYERLVRDHGKTVQELYEIFSPSAPKQDKQK